MPSTKANNGPGAPLGAQMGVNPRGAQLYIIGPDGNSYAVQGSTMGGLGVTIVGGSVSAAPPSPTSTAYGRSTVTTSPAAAALIVPANPNRRGVMIQNVDPVNAIYVGSDSLTSPTTGFPVPPGGLFQSLSTSAIYGSSAAGTPAVSWFADIA